MWADRYFKLKILIFCMSTSRKISEAENILEKMKIQPSTDFKIQCKDFCKIVNEIFLDFSDEYAVKFGFQANHTSFEKFKVLAKKAGKIEAINFLIWYEKEYKRLRNDPTFGNLLEKEPSMPENQHDTIRTCSALLDEIKNTIYYAYENF